MMRCSLSLLSLLAFTACFRCLLSLLAFTACFHCLLSQLAFTACFHCLQSLLTVAACSHRLLSLLAVTAWVLDRTGTVTWTARRKARVSRLPHLYHGVEVWRRDNSTT